MPKLTCCSGTVLKRFACLAMLLDHIGAACLEVGMDIPYLSVFYIGNLSALTSDPTTQKLILLNCILRSIGRLAMPIFAFFIAEGFLHTKNAPHYLLRLVCFGLISEPIFDFTFFGTFYYPAYQSIYATLALGLLGLILLRAWDAIDLGKSKLLGCLSMLGIGAALVITVAAADLFHTDYGASGVLLILVLYMLRKAKALQSLALVLCTTSQFPAPFAAVPLALYNGTRGNCARWEKWAFYTFYPAHLLILGLITNLLL